MDLLDRLLGHDAWTTRQLLLRCRGLADAALDREFDIGHRTVRATLAHITRNVAGWSELMSGPAAPSGRRGPAGAGRADLGAPSRSGLTAIRGVPSHWAPGPGGGRIFAAPVPGRARRQRLRSTLRQETPMIIPSLRARLLRRAPL